MVTFSKRKTAVVRSRSPPAVDAAAAKVEHGCNFWKARQEDMRAKIPANLALPAVHAVINTVELLEQILLGLDMKTLLLAQRVNRDWNTVITESSLLQKKLFLLPATQAELSRLNIVEESSYADIDKEDLVQTTNVWSTSDESWNHIGHAVPEIREIIVHNPLLLRQRPVKRGREEFLQLWQMPRYGSGCRPMAYLTRRSLPPPPSSSSVNLDDNSGGNTHRPLLKTTTTGFNDPSWDRMLLAQPTDVRIMVELTDDPTPILHTSHFRFYFRSVFKLGQFLTSAELWRFDQQFVLPHLSGRYMVPVLFGRDGRENTTGVTVIGRAATVEEVREVVMGTGGGA